MKTLKKNLYSIVCSVKNTVRCLETNNYSSYFNANSQYEDGITHSCILKFSKGLHICAKLSNDTNSKVFLTRQRHNKSRTFSEQIDRQTYKKANEKKRYNLYLLYLTVLMQTFNFIPFFSNEIKWHHYQILKMAN